MSTSKRFLVFCMWVVACTSRPAPSDDGIDDDGGTPEFESPVATNPEPPVRYPPTLYEQQIEGTVVLRLFADETGAIVPDSTRIAEGSGHPEFDSAALAAVAEMHFAPARRNGIPVATAFLQPVRFQHPEDTELGGGA